MLRGFFILDEPEFLLTHRGRTDTTKCAHRYIVYLMAPETHSPYCPTISEAP
jgi:hypothetical protein